MIKLPKQLPWVARLLEATKCDEVILFCETARYALNASRQIYDGKLSVYYMSPGAATKSTFIAYSAGLELWMLTPYAFAVSRATDNVQAAMVSLLVEATTSGIIEEILVDYKRPTKNCIGTTPSKSMIEFVGAHKKLYELKYTKDNVKPEVDCLDNKLLDPYIKLSNKPFGAVTNFDSKLKMMKTIGDYESSIELLTKRIETLKSVMKAQVAKTEAAFSAVDASQITNNVMRSEKYLAGEDKGYSYAIEDGKVVLTLINLVLSCKCSALIREEREYYSLPGNREQVYWPIGTIDVIFSIDTYSVDISYRSVNSYSQSTRRYHPHISGSSLCSDPRIASTALSCIKAGRYDSLAKYMRQFLGAYNPSSPYDRPHEMSLPCFKTREEAACQMTT